MIGYKPVGFLILLITLTGVMGGCNIIRVTMNTPLTAEDVAFIVPGQTTLTEVIQELGSPDSITDSTAGFVAIYRFADLRYSRVNFGYLLKPWSPVDPDLIMSRTGLGTDAFEVLYNSDGVVTQHNFLRRLAGTRYDPYPF
jgi:hypothetical protein